jgi:hypothetical protein
MFKNNIHKNQIYLFGSEVAKNEGTENEAFQSEYQRRYEESLRKNKIEIPE